MSWPIGWKPPHIVAWRALWFVPLAALVCALLFVVTLSHGPAMARRVFTELV